MLDFMASHEVLLGVGVGVPVVLLWLVFKVGCVVIGEGESGLVIKRFGAALPPGRLIARGGEAGYQARLLSPGWHLGLWRWRYKVKRVPLIVVPPGEVALVVANDGQPLPGERLLGCAVECDGFQDAEAFLDHGGERGRQLSILTAGTYRINPALFDVVTVANAKRHGVDPTELRVFHVPPDRVGIVTANDGRPVPAGDMAGPIIPDHDSFQRPQAFIDAGGCRGLQEEVLLAGAWNLNPWFVKVELIPLTEIPIGYVGVVVSYVGREHLDVSGDAFTHGDLVERGRKGVWVEPLLPGKHPLNTRVMKVELVPTTNIVLNWANRTEAHHYDSQLSSILVRSKDGFGFSLDVSQIIHIGAKNAPRVISRVGSMQNLVDHVLQPVVGNYFRNSAQEVTVLDFLSARSARQQQAYDAIQVALQEYDVECIDTLIGDIVPPAELMKTQTDRKIAEELQRTYEVQREAEVKRQDLQRELAIANIQSEVVRSEQQVRICEQNARAQVETAKGEAASVRARSEAEAESLKRVGLAKAEAEAEQVGRVGAARAQAEAEAVRQVGLAKAEAYRMGQEALGAAAYTAMQIATVLAEHGVKLVPDIAVGGGQGGQSGLAEAMLARMFAATQGLPMSAKESARSGAPAARPPAGSAGEPRKAL
ncbi:hypothetical protein KRR26_09755 [Corallococcus sp. M34]|uniref:SPFH domain-containing protein n=1 Tax=Citreicoccus inhibens TaxID=2849499 RepID=UPI001C215A4C|nr:SPFH domain-containing protein [Citreicoccus inhibens]MBU8895890.1 hypothetical protein [Citreicoccus inhibens]